MKRPSRSFTVEVKRSRSRAGEPAAGDKGSEKGKAGRDSAAAVSGALSWGDLIDRVSKEIAVRTGLPDADAFPAAKDHPEAGPDSGSAPGKPLSGKESSGKADQDVQRSRVLPSLLPLDLPLSERKSRLYAHAGDSRASPGSRLPKTSPRQLGVPPTELARGPGMEPPATVFAADRIAAVVEEHLRRRAGTENLPSAPLAVDREPALPVTEVDGRPTGRRRREDFWKRRLRSYAARD